MIAVRENAQERLTLAALGKVALRLGDDVDQRNRLNQIVECGANVGCDVSRGCREVFGEQHELYDTDARKRRRILIEHNELAGHGGDDAAHACGITMRDMTWGHVMPSE